MSLKAITIGAALAACAVVTAPAAAQQRGTVEFGAFGSAGTFDKGLTLDRGIGAGGHVGIYLDPRWAIEFEDGEMKASRTLGLANVNVGLLSARLVATPIKSGAWSMMIGAGGGASTETNFLHSYGVNAMIGTKIALSDYAAIRIDAIADWLANYDWKSQQRLQAGLTFYRSPQREDRLVEVPMKAVPCNCAAQRPDSVSAAETARLRGVDQAYANLRDSLSRHPAPIVSPVSSLDARAAMEDRIHFAFNKSDLTDSAKANLDGKVAVFNANPTMTIVITGNTDNIGTENYNEALGMRRAASAKAYLVSRGIAEDRIAIDSKGEMNPVVSPAPAGSGQRAQNAPNRRDAFVLIITPDIIKKP